jgi:Domain of unknown function (DUF5606)
MTAGVVKFALPTAHMDLTKIITVAGKSGLHRVVATGRQALIVESLAEGKRFPVPLSVKVSSLEEISMFTTGDDAPLRDVLFKLHEANAGGAAADPKGDDNTLWDALLKALPTADRERIYASDVRKLFTWYAQLLKAGEFTKKEEEAKSDEHAPKEEGKAKKATEKGVKKKAAVAAKSKPGGASAAPKAAAVRRGGQRGS